MSQEERIIAEQRQQLMQLRAENKRLKARTGGVLAPTWLALQHVVASFLAKPVGTTIGLKVDPVMRARLIKQQGRFEAKSYRQVVQACIELGLRRIEETRNDKPSAVEEVPVVQRADDQGNRAVRTAAN